MYNTKLICTYHYYDPVLSPNLPPHIKEQVEDMEESATIMYQAEFLQVFDVSEMQEEIIIGKMKDLHEKIKDNEEWRDILKIMSTKLFTEDEVIGLMVLYSYPLFYLIHPCICQFLNEGTICREKMEELKKVI